MNQWAWDVCFAFVLPAALVVSWLIIYITGRIVDRRMRRRPPRAQWHGWQDGPKWSDWHGEFR